MAQPYAHEDAWNTDWLRVDDIHEVYYEQYGPKEGKPVIFLHGGPGGHISKTNTDFFDPSVYRVILLDQRGCGKSRPYAESRQNTTWDLVDDIEALRKHLSIPKWHVVFGGSWGSTLGLAYAQTYPQSVGSLVLRGIFTVRELELKWSFDSGANRIFPDRFDELVNFLPEEERGDVAKAYHKRLLSDDDSVSQPAAMAWNKYEMSISKLQYDPDLVAKVNEPGSALAHARLEAHYFMNKAWLKEGQLLARESIDKIRHIPAVIVQGRYDVVCPGQTAWDLWKAWPESKLYWVADAGHSALEPGTHKRLTEACDEFAKLDL